MAIGDGPTRLELLNQLATRLNKNPPPNMDAATEMRLVSYLNQRQRRLLTMPGLTRLRDATITFTSIPLQPHIGLPTIAKVSRIWEITNDRNLYELSQQDYRLITPNPESINGTPEAFVWTGRQVVAHQPVAPSALFVQSSNPLDTVTTIHVEGVLTSGETHGATMALNGTTATNLAPAITSWTRIDKCFLSAPVLGTVTLTDSGSAILASIPAGQVTSVYTGLTLYPTPSAAMLYYVDITRPVTDLVQPTDQAAIPEDFADLLVLGALADEYQHLADARWSAAMTEYKERENQLKYWLAETHSGRPFGLSRSYQRPSQLGSWFPAGT